jgi:predicted TIM-barrel fold metal-dependent hydrolase
VPTIDVQVHVYERNHAGRPWAAVLHGPSEVTGDQMVKAMDEVGVDGAILVSPYTQYRYDPSYALEVRARHPDRFAVVKPVDSADPKVGETIADWKKTPGTVGIRIMMAAGPLVAPDDPGVNRVLAEAARHSLPVNVLSWGRLEQIAPLAKRNPNTRIVIDHLGILQPFEPPKPAEPWADLPKLLALAQCDNVVVKISGAGTLSKQPCPYTDIWDHVRRIIDTFGLERCMWGTDWTRAVAFLTYKEGVDAFRLMTTLSDSDRAALMGGTLQKVYGWSPKSKG